MLIEEQQAIASTLRTTLVELGFDVTGLLGGAPRNWSQGFLARDLDFYTPDHGQDCRLEEGEIDTAEGLIELGESYEGQHINCVQEFFFQGVKVNLIYTNLRTVTEIMNTFPVSISKAYYDFTNNRPVLTKEARLSFATEILVVNQSPEVEQYIEKICYYFPRMRIGTSVDMAYKCMDMVLAGNHVQDTPTLAREVFW